MSRPIRHQFLKTASPNAHAEAERRAKFVRGMGSAVIGYCDGYADGFEHAVAWLMGQACDPLSMEYRPGSGMSYVKSFYKNNPKERVRILKWFEELSSAPEVDNQSQKGKHVAPTNNTNPRR
jgi:hypothetical protein